VWKRAALAALFVWEISSALLANQLTDERKIIIYVGFQTDGVCVLIYGWEGVAHGLTSERKMQRLHFKLVNGGEVCTWSTR